MFSDSMKPAERIIEKFGGVNALARALGHRHPTTVHGWKTRGYIPGPQHGAVFEAAAREGIELGAADFVDMPPGRQAEEATA